MFCVCSSLSTHIYDPKPTTAQSRPYSTIVVQKLPGSVPRPGTVLCFPYFIQSLYTVHEVLTLSDIKIGQQKLVFSCNGGLSAE